MTGNFIYVFDKEVRDELLSRGYTLLYSDEAAGRYVFANEASQMFSLDRDVVVCDKLTF